MFRLPLPHILVALAGLFLATSSPWASEWPTHTLRLVVGFPAGSSPDLTARALA